MANGRQTGRAKSDSSRDSGGFIALPWAVLDCPAYVKLSHPAKALLFEIARQFVRDNNGRLLASAAYLKPRGWSSADVITRAKRELLAAGFIHETVKGHRPNKASWYAVTWRTLDLHPGFDPGAAEAFCRGSYKTLAPIAAKPTRDELYAKWRVPAGSKQFATPSPGVETPSIAPPHGVGPGPAAPSPGAIGATFGVLSTPSPGNHLDMPSAVSAA